MDGSKPYPVVILLPSEPFGYRLAACAGEKVAGSTFHLSAAVAIKIERAAAPAWRSGVKKARTEVEPAVTWKPMSRLAKRLSSAGALVDLHLGEANVELLGDQHRHRGVGALAHLDLRDRQGHAPVAVDPHESVRRKILRVGSQRTVGRQR
jgi:hypothetical protein